MKLTAILPLAMSAVFLTACTQDTPAEQVKAKPDANAPLIERINNGGTLVVGTEGTYPPFTYRDESGKLTGYDVEVVRAIAKKLGVQVEFKEMAWQGLLLGLDAKRFDVVANQVALTTPERQAQYNKSEPYSWSGLAVLSLEETKLTNWNEIKGKRSAQSLGTNYAERATKYGAKVVGVKENDLEMAAAMIKQGHADITLNDSLAVLDYLKKHPNSGFEIKLEVDPSEKKGAGVIFRKDETEAVAKFSEVTKQLQADGTLAKLGEQFFGEDVSKK